MLFTAAALSSLSLIASLSSTVAAHGSHNTHQRLHLRQAADDGSVVITSGSRSFGDGQVHSRLEVSDMFTNRPDQWSLLILAMRKFQDEGTSNVTGYYAISGIHGVPRDEWNGVAQCDSCEDADGYCTHDSVLFPAWHRAYTALFEQEFLKVAQEVADSYPSGNLRRRMQSAVETLRFPYWDWAAKPEGEHCLPEFLSAQKITITGQNGDEEIDNPLRGYNFVDPSLNYYGPFNEWPSTLRYPNSDSVDATSDEQSLINAFDNTRQTLQDQVYSLLANCDNYLYFSNDAPGGTYERCANSLEQIHNSVHTTGGGAGSKYVRGGHLTYLPLAAFDPIFWFHHCQVDRIFALWQAIYPNSYGAQQVAPHSTWTVAAGSTQNIDSDLTPFRDSANSFWTTRKVQDWENTFGYTYPEFASTDGSRHAIINAVNSLYGANANQTAPSISQKVEKSSLKRSLQAGVSLGGAGVSFELGSDASQEDSPETQSGTYSKPYSTAPYAPLSTGTGYPIAYQNMTTPNNTTFTTNNGSTYEYMCHFQTPRYTLNGSYVVYAFDGTPESDDTTTWNADKSCIGSIGIMAGGDMANPNVIAYGGVPMTRHLQERCKEGKLKGMEEKHVTPYLAQNLEWKIVRQGEVIQPDAVPNFQAVVYSGTSSPAGPNSLGSWNSYTPQVEVTKDKAGGAQSAPVSDCDVPVSPVSPSQSGAVPYPAPNGTVSGGYGYPPAGTGAASGTSSNQPPAYTGGAGKPSFQIAGLLAAVGLVAVL